MLNGKKQSFNHLKNNVLIYKGYQYQIGSLYFYPFTRFILIALLPYARLFTYSTALFPAILPLFTANPNVFPGSTNT